MENILWDDVVFKLRKTRQKLPLSLTPLGAVRAAAEGTGYKNRRLGKSRGVRFDSRLVSSVHIGYNPMVRAVWLIGPLHRDRHMTCGMVRYALSLKRPLSLSARTSACSEATCTRIRFEKIRFRKDPFWGVHTYRMSIRRPRSHGRGLIPGNVPPPLCWQRRTHPELKSHLFCLFPLLASVILLYCFTCLCPEEGVYVVWESWRQVIKEVLQRRNETQTKDEAKWNKTKHPTFV